MEVLRVSLIPSLLNVVRYNIDHGLKDLRLFEIGKVYFYDKAENETEYIKDYCEKDILIFAFTGLRQSPNWDRKPQLFDIFDVKGEAEAFLDKILLDNIKFIPYPNTDALTEYGIRVENNDECIGTLGKIRKGILKRFNIDQDVYVVELHVALLEKHRQKEREFKSLPKYPSVMRDIAIIVDEHISVKRIEDEIRKSCNKLLSKLLLFDIYRGDPIEKGKKSCAYALELMAEDHTMSQDEIDKVMNNIIQHVGNNLNATIRR